MTGPEQWCPPFLDTLHPHIIIIVIIVLTDVTEVGYARSHVTYHDHQRGPFTTCISLTSHNTAGPSALERGRLE